MGSRVIAIDGPSASGKSTVARKIAGKLGYIYVDSGALYRGITWKALQDGIQTDDGDALEKLMDAIEIKFFVDDKSAARFRIDGVSLVEELRTSEINENVSKTAAEPKVRTRIVSWLRDMAELGDLVIEGRDIGTAVFPGADSKFYLDASIEERAKRRYKETVADEIVKEQEVQESLAKRDSRDQTRKVDPLKIADDAVVVDTTGMSIDEVVEDIIGKMSD